MAKYRDLSFLGSTIFISLLSLIVHSVSGQTPLKQYEASELEMGLLNSYRQGFYRRSTASEEITHNSVQPTRKYKKYYQKFKTHEASKLILSPHIKYFSTNPKQNSEHPFVHDFAYGENLMTQQEDTTFGEKKRRRNRNDANRRSRRQAGSQSKMYDDEGSMESVDSEGSKKISQSITTHKASHAVQTGEARKSHTQQSDAKEQDEYTYNADGSVKTRTTVSSSSNKQEFLHISKTKSVIPVSESLDPESVIGKDENGNSRSLLSYSELAPLGSMPEMEAMEQATTSPREDKSQSSSESDSKGGKSRDRSVNGGSYLPSKGNKNGRSLGVGQTKRPNQATKSKQGNNRDRSLNKGAAPPKIRKSGGEENVASPTGFKLNRNRSGVQMNMPAINSRSMQQGTGTSSSNSYHSSSSSQHSYGDPPPEGMKINSRGSGTQMFMPVMSYPPMPLPPFPNFGPPGVLPNQGYQPAPMPMQMYNNFPRYS